MNDKKKVKKGLSDKKRHKCIVKMILYVDRKLEINKYIYLYISKYTIIILQA